MKLEGAVTKLAQGDNPNLKNCKSESGSETVNMESIQTTVAKLSAERLSKNLPVLFPCLALAQSFSPLSCSTAKM
jgi:hypothetical protein